MQPPCSFSGCLWTQEAISCVPTGCHLCCALWWPWPTTAVVSAKFDLGAIKSHLSCSHCPDAHGCPGACWHCSSGEGVVLSPQLATAVHPAPLSNSLHTENLETTLVPQALHHLGDRSVSLPQKIFLFSTSIDPNQRSCYSHHIEEETQNKSTAYVKS